MNSYKDGIVKNKPEQNKFIIIIIINEELLPADIRFEDLVILQS